MADTPTGGPMVRARAVMTRAPEGSVVLSHRTDFQGLPGIPLECCYPRDPQTVLAAVDADVIVSDYQHWHHADADGRPVLKIGFAHREETMWDLDAGPLHPWCAPDWIAPDRDALREELELEDSDVCVMSMSPSSMRLFIERRLDFAGVRHVQARTGLDFFAADLIVTSAGWSSYHEAEMSGVPFCAITCGGQDQHLRITHSWEEAQVAIGNASRVRDVESPCRVDWAGELLSLL